MKTDAQRIAELEAELVVIRRKVHQVSSDVLAVRCEVAEHALILEDYAKVARQLDAIRASLDGIASP